MKKFLLTLLVLCGVVKCCAAQSLDSVAAVQACPFSWRNSAVGAASAVVINAVATDVLKSNIRSTRPDGSAHNSFPSRHTSYMFTLASVGARELSRFSPLWIPAMHTAANVVAMQRVYSSRHYPIDVLAGASIGIVSTELAYRLSDLIFKSDRCHLRIQPPSNERSLSTATTALITFCSHSGDYAVGCGIESTIGLSIPLTAAWGIGVAARSRSLPVYYHSRFIGALNGAGASVGVYALFPLGLWQIDASASIGLLRNFRRPAGVSSSWAPLGAAEALFLRTVATGVALGASIGADITNRPSAVCALSVSLATRVRF